MNTTALCFPVLTDVIVPSEKAPAIVTIKEAAIMHMRSQEPNVRALAERYRAVAFDLTTPKGLAYGKAARLDLRENGRFALQRARDATKDLLNGAKKDVEAEADRLIAIVKPVEDHVHGQIEARETVLAAEKAERDRIEAEAREVERVKVELRKAGQLAGLAALRNYVTLAQGMPSARIASGIAAVEAIIIDPAVWDEFFTDANTAKDETLANLRSLHAKTEAAEEDAMRAEAQRIEQARVAEEQRIERDRLAAERAEVERMRAEIAAAHELVEVAERKRVADEAALLAADIRARQAQEARDAWVVEQATARAAAVAPPAPIAVPAAPIPTSPAPLAAVAPPSQPDTRPPFVTSALCERLGFNVHSTLLKRLGINPVANPIGARTGIYWAESDYPSIKAALVRHIQSLDDVPVLAGIIEGQRETA